MKAFARAREACEGERKDETSPISRTPAVAPRRGAERRGSPRPCPASPHHGLRLEAAADASGRGARVSGAARSGTVRVRCLKGFVVVHGQLHSHGAVGQRCCCCCHDRRCSFVFEPLHARTVASAADGTQVVTVGAAAAKRRQRRQQRGACDRAGDPVRLSAPCPVAPATAPRRRTCSCSPNATKPSPAVAGADAVAAICAGFLTAAAARGLRLRAPRKPALRRMARQRCCRRAGRTPAKSAPQRTCPTAGVLHPEKRRAAPRPPRPRTRYAAATRPASPTEFLQSAASRGVDSG
eukprot:351469-Chlamydomonas_euryale.AAC.6